MAPSRLRGRKRLTTYLYDDPKNPDRITGEVESAEWTGEDRALLLALQQHELTLCPGCGHPKQLAWHSEISGLWESERWICNACKAADGSEQVYSRTHLDPDFKGVADLPPLQPGVNTVEPSRRGGDS